MSKNKTGDGPGRGDHLRKGKASGTRSRKKNQKESARGMRRSISRNQKESAGGIRTAVEEAGGGVAGGVDFFEAVVGNLGVNLSRRKELMA